jgi:3-deoxy-manno-octulosonate cytidylyltransferase (CMP-KDO synthetase)
VKTVGIIPARYGSTRFPGKPLALIGGRPLVLRVVERVRQAQALAEVVVATDDERIRSAVAPVCRVEMTSADHASGTDRVAEVAARLDCDGVINVQGDEPMVDPGLIDQIAKGLKEVEMVTAATPLIDPAELEDPNVVKVVVSDSGRALYFSRRTIPYLREAVDRSVTEQLAAFPFLRHLGIYGYRREALARLVRFPVSALEEAEQLEQLRALSNDVGIRVVVGECPGVGVDTPADVARVEALLGGGGGAASIRSGGSEFGL